ncbi:MAG TPA: YoaK family protein [Thermoleophilaceae bacterium]|jgi:uncharacterized membrane protein YoaK (UPF0700 family)|nr:YoaK family protein [Thermoleophilaceae bacterium]
MGAPSIDPPARALRSSWDRDALSRLDPARVRDGLLVALTLSSGAVDAISWLALGKVFSAFMTGNLVFVGLRAGGAAGPSVPRVLTALLAFAAGAAVSGRIVGRAEESGVVWPRRVTAALAAALVAQAAFLALWVSVGGRPSSGTATALIALSALAMGVQATAVFALGVRAIVTTAATGLLAVLMADLAGWRQPPAERRRLATCIVGLLAGAIVGATLVVHARSCAAAFPLVVSGLAVLTAALAFPQDAEHGT